MKILIDECLPKSIKKEFPKHFTMTVKEMGWDSKTNGSLMAAAIKEGFEIFVTIDKNLQHQQNSKKYKITVIVLDSKRNDIDNLKLIIPKVLDKLAGLEKGKAYQFE